MESIGQVTVDIFGNVNIPPDVCERLGWRPGEKLLLEKGDNGEVWLKPTAETNGDKEECLAKVVEKNGLLLIDGIPPELLEDIVEREREARMNELMKGVLP